MSELLLEILSEEIPARMQVKAKLDMEKLFSDKLLKNNLKADLLEVYISPRRLVLYAKNIAISVSEDQEIKGPKIDAKLAAIEGFARKYGKTIDELEKRETDKGSFFFITNKIQQVEIRDILVNIINDIFRNFPWPKSMKWGEVSDKWIRPIRNILCIYDGKILPVSYANISANDYSRGHRYLAPESFKVMNFSDYKTSLEKKFVIIDFNQKLKLIEKEIEKISDQYGYACPKDERLLEEIAGLVEYPIVLIGEFNEEFLALPEKILVLTMKTHQRYLPLYNKKGNMANKFIIVSNIDGDAAEYIVKGNEKVINARFSDAKFFYEQDRKIPFISNINKLANITFHEKLGTMLEKTDRLINISKFIAKFVPSVDETIIERAAELSKADLVTNMVNEFPELQGFIGKIYSNLEGYDDRISRAIEEHYFPIGSNSELPSFKEAAILAIADKIDNIIGFFGIDEAPTSSKDPYGLRRAALGIVKIITENNINIMLDQLFDHVSGLFSKNTFYKPRKNEVIEFILERFKYHKRSSGVRIDIYDAVIASGIDYDISRINNKISTIEKLIEDTKYISLFTVLNRAINLLGDNKTQIAIDPALFEIKEEANLYNIISSISDEVQLSYQSHDYVHMFNLLCDVTHDMNNIFEKVVINDTRENIKNNRVSLINMVINLVRDFAEFSLINIRN